MANTNSLNNDALMYSICYTLARSYRVAVDYIPEKYIAADVVCDDFEGRNRVAHNCIRAFEHCAAIGPYEISSVSFLKNDVPIITINNETSFQLTTTIGKKKSWRASRSTSVASFFTLLGYEDISEAERMQDPLDAVADFLSRMDSPKLSHEIVASLIPTSNFITLCIDQNTGMVQSTAFFYSFCGHVDKKVDFPKRLLEIRRKNKTALRCIYDNNWLFDFRLRWNAARDRHRLEWFLKDYPVGVICQAAPIDVPVQVRIST